MYNFENEDNIFIMDHPLIQHKITQIRDKNTGTQQFRKCVEEIATLISENEPYQKLNDLVEMIGETFCKPKPGEQVRWWGLKEISDLLSTRYANYDPKTTYVKLGRALSDQKFSFEDKHTATGQVYKLCPRE